MNLVASLGQGATAQEDAAPAKIRKRGPYRNLDVWPRARALLADASAAHRTADGGMFSGDIARALGVETKCVLMAFAYHAEEVERTGEKGAYRWRLRGAA